jgi:uncharacterized protein (TIGR01777 family)
MKNILIAGGTGFLGRKIQKLLESNGHTIKILSRSPKSSNEFYWNPETSEIDEKGLNDVQIIINLCGASIGDKKWTKKRKIELFESRIKPTQFLFSKIEQLPHLEMYVTASGVTCYGFQDDTKIYNENDPFGDDFTSNLVKEWESAADLFKTHCNVVKMRISVVLDNTQGALSKISLPVRFGFGSPLGSGKQMFTWVHINDLTNAFQHVINFHLDGVYNIVGGTTTNEYFTKLLAKALNKPFWMPKVPAFILRLILGELSVIILKGINVSNQKLIDTGFKF